MPEHLLLILLKKNGPGTEKSNKKFKEFEIYRYVRKNYDCLILGSESTGTYFRKMSS